MKFGVIGPGKMGRLYLRDFINLGGNLNYIKSSSKNKTEKLKNKLIKIGKLKNKKLKDLDTLIISSKTNTHYKYINKFFRKKKLLIEKPFFFCKNKSYNWHLKKAKLFLKSGQSISVNLSNYILADAYKKQLNLKPIKKDKFYFSFYTQGKSKFKFIILDLMPHFFSIIQRLTTCNKMKIISKKINKYSCNLILKIDNFECFIDLKENQKNKSLSFGFEDFIFLRRQYLYKNFLKNFICNKEYKIKIETPNPFTYFIQDYYKNNGISNLSKEFIYKNFDLTLKTYF